MYLIIDHSSGYIEEKGVNKYFIFESADENKELLKRYNDVFNGIRNKIKKISGNECDHKKDYMKIKFNSDNDLPLNKQLKFHNMTITIISVFEEDGKLYPQVFLDDFFVWIKELIFQKRLMLIKQIYQKIFVTIGILKILVLIWTLSL